MHTNLHATHEGPLIASDAEEADKEVDRVDVGELHVLGRFLGIDVSRALHKV